MKEMLKKNATLVIALALPVLMIVLVAASVYIPSLFSKPAYDFLYTVGNIYTETEKGHVYSVENEKLIRKDGTSSPSSGPRGPIMEKSISTDAVPAPRGVYADGRLYYHDIVKNESREISFEDAQKLRLSGNVRSSDGYEIVPGSGSSPMPFGGGYQDFSQRYITGHNTSKKLNLALPAEQTYNFKFIGWVVK